MARDSTAWRITTIPNEAVNRSTAKMAPDFRVVRQLFAGTVLPVADDLCIRRRHLRRLLKAHKVARAKHFRDISCSNRGGHLTPRKRNALIPIELVFGPGRAEAVLPPIPNRQLPLFARRAVIEYPNMRGTADALGEVEADDHFRYHVKGDINGYLIRASEWLCTHIAEEVGIAAPTPMVIAMSNGTTAFGSRRISGVAEETATKAYLFQPSNSNLGSPPIGLNPLLSAIYALDMFIFNDDRHPGNHLSIDDQGKRRLYTFDFSRAMFWKWPWAGFPPKSCNTRLTAGVLRMLHGFDPVAAATIIDRLDGLPLATVEGFVNRMPQDWLPESRRADLLDFWGGSRKSDRIEGLRKGFGDGTIL